MGFLKSLLAEAAGEVGQTAKSTPKKNVNKEELLKALELADKLVRCKECKHWLDGSGLCKHWSKLYGSVLTKADDFCSYGEREGE